MKPSPAPRPTSRAGPVPGYSGDWWIEQNRTSSRSRKIAFVPLPWCTSKSKISTRRAPCASIACCAPIAMLSNRQKPIACARSAWWPGGRCSDAPAETPSSPSSASTSATAPPAACSAASNEPGLTIVSMSIIPPPRAQSRSMRSMCSGGWIAAICSRVAAGDSRTSQPSQSRSLSARSIATIRRAFSGCAPVSCSSDDGWRSRTGAAIRIPYPAGARRTGDQQRPRGRRRRCRRPVRRPARGERGRVGRARVGDAARADRELLGPGRDRRRARGRGLLRAPSRRHRGGGPPARAPLGRRGARPRGAAVRQRPRADGRALRRRPPRRARARPRGRALASAASCTRAAARRAAASCASSRRSPSTRRASRCSRARARRAPGCTTAAAPASCSRTAAPSAPARRSSPPAAPRRCGRARRTRRARWGSACRSRTPRAPSSPTSSSSSFTRPR